MSTRRSGVIAVWSGGFGAGMLVASAFTSDSWFLLTGLVALLVAVIFTGINVRSDPPPPLPDEIREWDK